MIEAIKKMFKGLFTVIVVLGLVAVVIGGFYVMGTIGFGEGLAALLVGLAIVIMSSGFIATLLCIDENLEIIANNTSRLGSGSGVMQTGSSGGESLIQMLGRIKKRCARCKKEVDEGYTACPHCGNKEFD